jgi:hypothetical protein
MEIAELKRLKLRIDKDEPNVAKSKTLSEDPRRAIPYIDKADPIRVNARTLRQDPIATKSNTLIQDPRRLIPSELITLPSRTNERRDNPLPRNAKLSSDKLEPKRQ